ncbi:MAG TPA: nuclear transport factor 2 family protein [Terriglobales bacterium]|nr:nuclear transport factor 2 family protein [Terriglobales bacterium]
MKWIVVPIMLICVPCLFVVAQDDAGVQSKIIALEKAWNQAYKLGDKNAISAILDDAIVIVNDDGSLQSKNEFLGSVKPSQSQEQQVFPESLRVHVAGNVALATGVFRTKGVEKGKPFETKDRFIDTWVNRGGAWVCVSAAATPVLH